MPGGLATGQLLDERYALEEPLGEDALGTTWRAHDRGLGRTVCLREIRYPDDVFAQEPGKLKQALMAVRLAIRLDHTGAVHVYDAFLDGDRLMMVTEAVATKSLASLVERKGPITPKRAAAIGLELLDPLAAAHAKGLVHGSLTPDAVLVPDRGPARLTGLGMAPSFLDAASRAWMDAMGTAGCLAPEQVELRGGTAASDLWALGATLYFAVEGTHAFDSVDGVLDSPPRPAANAKDLAPVLERLLSQEPAWRPDIEDLRPQLAEVAGVALGVAAAPATPPARIRRGRRDRRRADGDAEPEAPAALDWDAAVDDPPLPPSRAASAPDDTAWTDWTPGAASDTSDVWLPDLDYGEDDAPAPAPPEQPWPPHRDDDGDGDGGDTRMAVPDLTDDLDARAEGEHDEEDPFAAVSLKPWADDGTAAATWAPQAADALPESAVDQASAETPAATPETETGTGAETGAEAEADQPRRFRSAPSWPPPVRRRSMGVVVLCSLVMVVMLALLITNGRLGRSKTESPDQANNRPVLATDSNLVPRDWIAYRHPNVNFTVSRPPTWTLREEGSLIVVRDPVTGTELRVDYRKPRGPDPQETWLAQERDFTPRHPNDYKRLQLSPASYLGHVAALWEYTYLEANLPVHAVDLGFLTDDYGFTLSFRAPAGTWDTMLPVFHGFLSSVRAPE